MSGEEDNIVATKAKGLQGPFVVLSAALLLAILAGCEGAESPPSPSHTPTATATSVITQPDCPPEAQPFVIAPDEAFEAPLTVEERTRISAQAYWEVGPDHLALLINGPERPELENPEAPYARRDGPSGVLLLDYHIEEDDIQRGTDWRVRVANFGMQSAAGCLEVTDTPLASGTPTPMPMSRSGAYRVTYVKLSDSCDSASYAARLDDVLHITIQDGAIAIHQEAEGADSAGIIRPDGMFTTSGSGPTYLEVYEGRIEGDRIEAVNAFRQLGCDLEYSVTGERQ